uniref:Uncharacterized protein n=1 Tax=Anguilla anguilla TaxID=7936 RepID=A0A0E9UWA9_ANGAN
MLLSHFHRIYRSLLRNVCENKEMCCC